MFEIKFSRIIDKEYWNRIKKYDFIFGNNVNNIKKYGKERDLIIAKNKVKEFNTIWKYYYTDIFNEGIQMIYKSSFPDNIICYVNTGDYSIEMFDKNCIVVSMNSEDIITDIVHTACNFMFKKKFCMISEKEVRVFDKRMEIMKEVVTAINNKVFFGVKDNGVKQHNEIREIALKEWKKNNNIIDVIGILIKSIK